MIKLTIKTLILLGILIIVLIYMQNKHSHFKTGFIIIIGGIILLRTIYIGYVLLYKSNFENSIKVITKQEVTEKINYYEVNDRNYTRLIPRFEYQNEEVLVFQECFESYTDKKTHEVLNKYNNKCKIVDNENKEHKKDDALIKILNLIANLEHNLWRVKVIKENNNYYVVVALNVNWSSPYYLYKYNANQLIHLYTFYDEDIIAIKE